MSKRKICVVVTARPSYSRVKTALKAIEEHPDLELQLVVAASAVLERYGSTINYIERDGFKILAKVHMVMEGENLVTMAKTTGLGLLELPTVFDNLRPDLVVTIADRYETIATAITASYMNIPLVHIQGGEITGSIDEKVRHAITKLSNYHFVSTNRASERVIGMGEFPETVFVTGCPSNDIAREVMENPVLDFDIISRYGGVGESFDLSRGYFVVMQHPVTIEHEEAREQITETLYAIKEIGFPTLWFWPNVDAGADGTSKGIRAFREKESPQNIHFFKNMSSSDFLKVIYNSHAIIGNSSVGVRECSLLGVPSINIGSRQNRRERGANIIDVGYDRNEIINAIKSLVPGKKFESDFLYGDGYAGNKIAKLLAELPLTPKEKYLTL